MLDSMWYVSVRKVRAGCWARGKQEDDTRTKHIDAFQDPEAYRKQGDADDDLLELCALSSLL